MSSSKFDNFIKNYNNQKPKFQETYNDNKSISNEKNTNISNSEYTGIISNSCLDNGYYVAICNSDAIINNAEKLFINIFIIAEGLNEKDNMPKRHITLNDITNIIAEKGCYCNISFSKDTISDIDISDIYKMHRLPKDNIFMIILKSDMNTLLFVGDKQVKGDK